MIAAVICVAAVFLSAFFIRNAAISNSAKGNRDLLPEIRQTPYSIAVFGNTGVKRESINAIDFHDTLEEMPLFGWWDCSVKTNGGDGGVGYGPGRPVWEKGKSVYAWITKDDDGKRLHIAANGTVFALWDSMLLFENYTNLQEINFNGAFDAKNIVSADRMFMNCSSLEKIDLSGLHFSAVTTTWRMFENCSKLSEVDLSGFSGAYCIEDTDSMFSHCSSLKTIDMRPLHTSMVTKMSAMFEECSFIEELDLSGFNTEKVTNMDRMFSGCTSCKKFDISGFSDASLESAEGMFDLTTGEIICDTAKFNLSKWK